MNTFKTMICYAYKYQLGTNVLRHFFYDASIFMFGNAERQIKIDGIVLII